MTYQYTEEDNMILAIDPGNTQSAWVKMRKSDRKPIEFGIYDNLDLLAAMQVDYFGKCDTVIEMVASYGMPVGETVFETVFWIGRFYEAAPQYSRSRMKRMDIKMHLCHNSRAKDSNIRQALIDRFGEVGTKKAPGWFYGFKKDVWAAYAVGVTYADKTAAK